MAGLQAPLSEGRVTLIRFPAFGAGAPARRRYPFMNDRPDSVLIRRVLAALALLAIAAPASAQDTSQVAIGDRVRVAGRGWKAREGTFEGFDGEVVLVRTAGSGSLEAIPRSAIRRFEVNHGNQPARSQFGVGFVGGMSLGLAWGVAIAVSSPCTWDTWMCDPGQLIPAFTVFGATVGGVAGALTRREPWRSVRLEPRVHLSWLPGGPVGLGVGLTFGN